MEVRRVQFGSGENYSILLDRNSLPLPYPNLYVTLNHRNNSDASNTCHKVLEQIRYLYEILDFMKIDIVQRCMEGRFLTNPELETLVKWSKRKVHSFREHVAIYKSKNITSINPHRKKLEDARFTIVIPEENDISSCTSYSRITTYAKYIGWLETYCMPNKQGMTESRLLSMRPKKFQRNIVSSEFYENYKSLTRNQVLSVLDVVRPNSIDNPWVSEGIRHRNQLMVNLFEATGCRRGELAKIQLSDFKQSTSNGRWYVVIHSSVDFKDKRLLRPEAKTQGRRVPLDRRVMELVNCYIEEYRGNVTGAEFISHLFITHNHRISKNQAISLSAIGKVFQKISEVVKYHVHPHAFRHSWNDRYSENADKRIAAGKTTEEKSESDRRKIMGWTEKSKMAKIYSERHNTKRALTVGLELQEESSKEIDFIINQLHNDDC